MRNIITTKENDSFILSLSEIKTDPFYINDIEKIEPNNFLLLITDKNFSFHYICCHSLKEAKSNYDIIIESFDIFPTKEQWNFVFGKWYILEETNQYPAAKIFE